MASDSSAGPYLRRPYTNSISSRNPSTEKRQAHRPRLSTASIDSSRFSARAESETEGSEIHSPQPRRLVSPLLHPWLNSPPSPAPNQPPPFIRASSPLRHSSFSVNDATSGPSSFSSVLAPHLSRSGAPGGGNAASAGQEKKASTLDAARLESPTRRWVRWMAKAHLRPWTNWMIILGALWIRWLVGLGGYSGAGKPPMFGDYEAQRHWMEITTHLSSRQWYSYDLLYWGLDYPPLTAYHSWLCGIIGNFINPQWFELGSSRGFESAGSKTFMRATVIAFDLLIYVSAVVVFTRTWWATRSRRTQSIALLTVLFQPALILIDHGHFQYNSIMLGLTLWSINFFNSGHELLGAIAFVLSLGFKQMALYYAPAVFAYLLGACIARRPSAGRTLFVKIGLTTALSFTLLFLPFLRPPFPSLLLQSISRIFPFNRGLFEDKVANFWCASNVVLKWRNLLSPQKLMRAALGMTVIGILPSMGHVLRMSWMSRDVTSSSTKVEPATKTTSPSKPTASTQLPRPTSSLKTPPPPTIALLPLSLFTISLTFFLFSFQVHEKSILIPLLPLTLLMGGRSEVGADDVGIWEWGVLVNNVAMFSMWPLLKKDGQGLQYVTVTFLWNYLIGYNPLDIPNSFVKTLSLLTYTGIFTLHTAEIFFTPPQRYPDLFPVLNVLLSTSIFGLAWLWGMYRQVEDGWAITPLHQRTPQKHQNGSANPSGTAGVVTEEDTGDKGRSSGRENRVQSKGNGASSSQLRGRTRRIGSDEIKEPLT